MDRHTELLADIITSTLCNHVMPWKTTRVIIKSRHHSVGTCESFFPFESNLRIEFAVYHVSVSSCVKYAFTDILQFVVLISVLFNYYFTVSHLYEYETAQTTVVYTLHLQRIFNPSVFCICDEREWCMDYGTPNWVLVYFSSVIKRVKQCCCTLILLPK